MNLKPHCLSLALACASITAPLLAYAAPAVRESPAAVQVMASLPVTYALSEELLKGTEVKLVRAAPENLPASRQNAYFTGRGASSLADAAEQADAVIDLRSIWAEDPLYPLARRSNLRIVEIDAARPVDGALPGIALRPGTDIHAYPWLNSTNLGRMADILAADLERLAPDAQTSIQKNLAAIKRNLLTLTASNEARLAQVGNLSVFSLSERLDYLLSGLNLDPLDIEVQSDNDWTEASLQDFTNQLKDEDVALVVDHKQPSKAMADAIASSGARLIVIDSDPADPIKGLAESMDRLVEGLLGEDS